MTHIHTWGAKGRDPKPGDVCLTCPTTATSRRVTGYMASGYKPRTAQRERIVVLESANLAEISDPGDVVASRGPVKHLTGGARRAG